jgi:hypothetical protein
MPGAVDRNRCHLSSVDTLRKKSDESVPRNFLWRQIGVTLSGCVDPGVLSVTRHLQVRLVELVVFRPNCRKTANYSKHNNDEN